MTARPKERVPLAAGGFTRIPFESTLKNELWLPFWATTVYGGADRELSPPRGSKMERSPPVVEGFARRPLFERKSSKADFVRKGGATKGASGDF